MRVVFMGTPQIAATVLEALVDAHEVVAVYTRPDAVRGRGKQLVASPVKQLAQQMGIEVHTPKTMCDPSECEQLRAYEPDAICVVAYGAVLPREVIEAAPFGCLNVHTSLLPRWRGAAPMQRAILAGDEAAGVSIMRIEEGLDTGPYCKQVKVPLAGAYLADLEAQLADLGAKALVESLGQIEAGKATWTEQAQEGVTYAAKIDKGELDPDPAEPVDVFCSKVRASSDEHPAHAVVAGRGVTVLRAMPAGDAAALDLTNGLEPGQAIFKAKRLLLMAQDGPVEIEQVKPDGKKNMDARSFAAGIQGIKNSTITWEKA